MKCSLLSEFCIFLFSGSLFVLSISDASAQKLEWTQQTPQTVIYYGNTFLVDNGDNIYAGPDYNEYGNFIYKYDPNGNLLWTFKYTAPYNLEILFKFVLTEDGSIYAISNHNIVKATPSGKQMWVKISDTSVFEDIVAGENNSIIITASEPGLIEKLDSAGNRIWQYACSKNTSPGNVVLTHSKEIVASTKNATKSSIGYGLIKLDTNGAVKWKVVDSVSGSFTDVFSNVHLDSSDNSYLSGEVDSLDQNSVTYSYVTNYLYDADGQVLFKKPGYYLQDPFFLSKTSFFYFPGGNGSVLVYNDSLSYQRRFTYPFNNYAGFWNITFSKDKFYAGGFLQGYPDQVLLASFDSFGNPRWFQIYISNYSFNSYAWNILTDHEGNILVAALADSTPSNLQSKLKRFFLKYADTSQIISGLSKPNDDISHLKSFPNPFGDEIHITYQLPAPGFIRSEVCDLNGNVVVVLKNEMEVAGEHFCSWKPAANTSSGIYLLKMTTATGTLSKKITFIK